ncbi:hypothetical protein A2U01_0083937, partial [Trifolium medium]|nr:hypothetical protein [Trifolium medium]
ADRRLRGSYSWPWETDLYCVGLGYYPHVSDRVPAARLPDAVHRPRDGSLPALAGEPVAASSQLLGVFVSV